MESPLESAKDGIHDHPGPGLPVVKPRLPREKVKSRVAIQEVRMESKGRVPDAMIW